MFSTPTIPTDSLYKFLFVGGIVLVLASQYFIKENRVALSRISYNLDSLTTKNTTNEMELNFIIDSLNFEIQHTNPVKERTNNRLKKVKNTINQLKNHNKTVTNKIGNDIDDTRYSGILFLIMYGIGGLFTIAGYFFWNKHIQNPQDRLLKIQLEMAEIELKLKKKQLDSN